MICHAPNWWADDHRRNNPAQADLRIISHLDTIEGLRDIQTESYAGLSIRHEAEAIELVIWRQVGALI